MEQNLTREKYDSLKYTCETRGNNGEWRSGRKFVRRGRQWVTIAFLTNDGTPLMSSYSVYDVRIDGQVLEYDKYLTNSKRPEPFKKTYPATEEDARF